jgi:hypothetical protein
VRVDASRVAVEWVLSFGAVWLLWEEWRLLGLEDSFRQQLRVGKEQIGWGDLLAYRVVAQVAAPSSELAVVGVQLKGAPQLRILLSHPATGANSVGFRSCTASVITAAGMSIVETILREFLVRRKTAQGTEDSL